MTGMTTISIYPVGLLADLKHYRHRATRQRLRWGLRRLWSHLRKREWHAARGYFNGYLAEINYPPADLAHLTCGHGWTKRRAASRLGRYLVRDNPDRR